MANEIENHLLKDEKIVVQPIRGLTVNKKDGFTGFITNKRVIFIKKDYTSSNFQDIPYINLQAGISVQQNKDKFVLVFGIIFSLAGLILILYDSLIFIAFIIAGIILIMMWFRPLETLNLKGVETKFEIKAKKEVLYKMLKDIRNNHLQLLIYCIDDL
jgi:hypothetical protein